MAFRMWPLDNSLSPKSPMASIESITSALKTAIESSAATRLPPQLRTRSKELEEGKSFTFSTRTRQRAPQSNTRMLLTRSNPSQCSHRRLRIGRMTQTSSSSSSSSQCFTLLDTQQASVVVCHINHSRSRLREVSKKKQSREHLIYAIRANFFNPSSSTNS